MRAWTRRSWAEWGGMSDRVRRVYRDREVAGTLSTEWRLRALRPIAGCAAGLVAIAFSGCDRADTGAPEGKAPVGTEVHDSAGIPIVENRVPEPGSRLGWVAGDEPAVTIGTREASGAFQLHRVGDATRLADGRIVVANGGSNEVLVFDAEGNHLGAWAGQGDGPGEFWSLSTVRPWTGDSLIAADYEQGRVSVFDLAGAHGRTMSLRGPPDESSRDLATAGPVADAGPVGFETHVVLRVLPDGTLLTRTAQGYYTQGLWRWEATYALMDADGSTLASLGDHLGTEYYSESYEEDNLVRVMPLRHPFGKATLTTAWGDYAATGGNETYEIRAYRSDGSLARIVRRDHETRTPTRAEQDAAFQDRFAGLPEEDREVRMKVAANAPTVESFPAYSRLRGDALGYLWVAEFRLPDTRYDGTLWTVFDPDGRALGFVETPDGFDLFEIGADYILGSSTDDLGVEYVQLWELARTN